MEKTIENTLATYKEMGLRTKKSILPHLLRENAWESNLLPDISKFDYLHGNLGKAKLLPLYGLPTFVDDIYVFGYLGKSDVEKVGAYGTIRKTMDRIEERTEREAKEAWEKVRGEEAGAIFVAKVDVSELEVEYLEENIGIGSPIQAAVFQRIRFVLGRLHTILLWYATQRGSGLRETEGFRGTIVENGACVGEHVCTWLGDGERTKLYNKVVSKVEAGEVANPLGGHLAEYVDCTNGHLRTTFQHPDVQARGCNRIEISVYGDLGQHRCEIL